MKGVGRRSWRKNEEEEREKGKTEAKGSEEAGVKKKGKERFHINNLGILYQEQKYSP